MLKSRYGPPYEDSDWLVAFNYRGYYPMHLNGTSPKLAPLEPREQITVESILTRESPSRMPLTDEEEHDYILTRFGAACTSLPSDGVSPRMMRLYPVT